MIVYFVRHGETEANFSQVHQADDESLSSRGRSQAAVAGVRLKAFPIYGLIASTVARAHQTAMIIGDAIGLVPETTELLREIVRPSELIGRSAHDSDIVAIKRSLHDNLHNHNWHHSDEENFNDFTGRAKHVLEMLESRSEEHMVVVSHGVFLRIILCVMMFREKLTPALYIQFYHFFSTNNAGISICEHTNKGWRLITWNDYSHLLGDLESWH